MKLQIHGTTSSFMHNNMPRCQSLIQTGNDQCKYVPPPLNIQISRLQERIITNAKFGNMCKFMAFVTILGRSFSTRDEWKGNTMQGYQCNTNLCNQIFLHEDKGM